MPMRSRQQTCLTAPTYAKPRSHTPAKMISVGGLTAGAYPVASPGGYHIIRRVGDRIRCFSVNTLDSDQIWEPVESCEYLYEIADEIFDVEERPR